MSLLTIIGLLGTTTEATAPAEPPPTPVSYPARIYSPGGTFLGVGYTEADATSKATAAGYSLGACTLKTNHVDLTGYSNIEALGDSLTDPYDSITPTSDIYVNRIATAKGKTVSNRGVKSTGAFVAAAAAYQYLPQTNSDEIVTCLFGYNEINRNTGGSNLSATYYQIGAGVRAILCNQFLATATAASDGTKAGTWTEEDLTTTHGAKAGWIDAAKRCLTTTENGAELTFPFSGTSVVVGTFGASGEAGADYGSFDVYVDGILRASYSANGKADGVAYTSFYSVEYTANFVPDAVLLSGLSSGSHTLKIVSTSVKKIAIDYVGTLKAADSVPPVIVGEIPYTKSFGSTLADAARAKILEAIDAFTDLGYPVALARLKDYHYLDADLLDWIHPNNTGHEKIANAYLAVID
jgi:lysophospholipase L1-like esterase